MEGLIVGTVIGGQIGGAYGAAAGAALFSLYGLITGDVPFDGAGGGGGRGGSSGGRGTMPPEDLDEEIEAEAARADELEAEIEEQLRRQEELLGQIEKQEQVLDSVKTEERERIRAEPDDPLAAPTRPYERQIPESIFDTVQDKKTGRVTKTLDADRDGRTELQIEFDEMGRVLNRAEDTNYDGLLDAYNTYRDGQIVQRSEDTNHDGVPDRWVSYENGRGTREEIDRDFDGRRDGFRTYERGYLVREEHDSDNDGRIDRRVEYKDRIRVVELEDRDQDGKMDLQIFYDAQGLRAIRIEKDSDADGRTDIWEFYEAGKASKPLLARKEEDVNADGVQGSGRPRPAAAVASDDGPAGASRPPGSFLLLDRDPHVVDAVLLDDPEHLDDASVDHAPVRADLDGADLVGRGRPLDRDVEAVDGDRVPVQRESPSDPQLRHELLLLLRDLRGLGLGKLELDLAVRERGRDHVEDEQQQHDVDQRRHGQGALLGLDRTPAHPQASAGSSPCASGARAELAERSSTRSSSRRREISERSISSTSTRRRKKE
jgi:hypothetical protein